MGGLGVWAVAVALLGTSWLAEGHKSSKPGSAGAAGVDHAATPSPRSTVNVGNAEHACSTHSHFSKQPDDITVASECINISAL